MLSIWEENEITNKIQFILNEIFLFFVKIYCCSFFMENKNQKGTVVTGDAFPHPTAALPRVADASPLHFYHQRQQGNKTNAQKLSFYYKTKRL